MKDLQRRKLPRKREGNTYSFSVGGTEGYLHTGEYENTELGEIFIKLAKQGSTLSGWADALAILFSIALQYGAPLKTLVTKLHALDFEPKGRTNDEEIPEAKSVVDYIALRIGRDYLTPEDQSEIGLGGVIQWLNT